MKSPITATAVATVSLLLSSGPLTAGDLAFKVPSTARAQESAELLQRVAHALGDGSSGVAHPERISDLWLFPTSDASTVFAQYKLTSDDGSASSTEHLAVVSLSGDRIVRVRELTGSRD